MSEFLSAAWLAELDAAGRGAGPVAEIAHFTLAHVVTDVPGRGEVHYTLRFAPDGITLVEPTVTANVTFVTDYETATALAQGTTNAQQALAQGRLRVRGDIAVLTENASAVTRYADVFAAVRAATQYGSVDSRP